MTGRDVPRGRGLVVGIGDPVIYVIVITGQIDVRGLFLHSTEQQRPCTARRRLRFLEQRVREDVNGQGATEFRDVSVRVRDSAGPLDLVSNKDRVNVVRWRGPRRYGNGNHRIDLFVPDEDVLFVPTFPHVVRERCDLACSTGTRHRGDRSRTSTRTSTGPSSTAQPKVTTTTRSTPHGTSRTLSLRTCRRRSHTHCTGCQARQVGETPRPAQ
jgi:hypothetical protein